MRRTKLALMAVLVAVVGAGFGVSFSTAASASSASGTPVVIGSISALSGPVTIADPRAGQRAARLGRRRPAAAWTAHLRTQPQLTRRLPEGLHATHRQPVAQLSARRYRRSVSQYPQPDSNRRSPA